jgi:chaperonin cofactor prefoldin
VTFDIDEFKKEDDVMAAGVGSVLPASTLGAPLDFGASLSPDALMVYLSSRLDGLDQQINAIFNSQKAQEKVQSALRKIKTELAALDDNAGGDLGGDAGTNIDKAIEEIADIDQTLAADIAKTIHGDTMIFTGNDAHYTGTEVKATTEYIDGLSKDIESQSQMDMIKLQSLMSARQTAIQLATNMISSLGESSKAIVANIGR